MNTIRTIDETMEFFAMKASTNKELMSKGDIFKMFYKDTADYYPFNITGPVDLPGISSISVSCVDIPFLYPYIPNCACTVNGKIFVWCNKQKSLDETVMHLLEERNLILTDELEWWDKQYINDLVKILVFYFKTDSPNKFVSSYSNKVLHEPPQL